MKSTRELAFENFDALANDFFNSFAFYTDDEKKSIRKAWEFLFSKTHNDKTFFKKSSRIAFMLADDNMDAETIAASLLFLVCKSDDEKKYVSENFSNAISHLTLGLTKMPAISSSHTSLHQADAIRKMLFALSDDVRVILIKIAEKLDAIRTCDNEARDAQKKLAEEIISVWAPLADRLGMQEEKNEFEDLSLKRTNPDVFKQIKAIVSQKKNEREEYLAKAVKSIYASSEKQNIHVEVSSRAKHFYSIYQKMRKRNVEASELYDLLAVRIICETNAECYALVGIVHGLWKPLDRFKDYIAMPKANGYQSLHTTVMCEGKPLEIQIRTREMHEAAEHGIASHWLYKKGKTHDLVDVNHLGIFNELQEIRSGHVSDTLFFNTLKANLLGDAIYVFTPKGEVVSLPQGSNAIDFAYHIHSAIGEKIVGAKADGKIIPLTKELENTQIIEIITNPKAHPTRSQLAEVKTAKARQKIHAWLSANDEHFEEKISQAKIDETENLVTDAKATKKIRAHHKGKKNNSEAEQTTVPRHVKVSNEKNFLVNFAKCCNPKFPDVIVGYVSKNRGVTIHRANCLIYQRIPHNSERSVEVSWDNDEE